MYCLQIDIDQTLKTDRKIKRQQETLNTSHKLGIRAKLFLAVSLAMSKKITGNMYYKLQKMSDSVWFARQPCSVLLHLVE